jgi:guanylate kinase
MSRNNDAVSQHFSFPNPGGELDGLRVIDADINLAQRRWRITFDGNPSRRQLDKALSGIVGKTKLFIGENTDHDVTFATKYDTHRAKTNPSYTQQTMTMGDVIATTIIDNPCTEVEFEAEFDGMILKDPDSHFRKKTFSGGYKKAKFRKLLWSTVTKRGESYGWVTSNKDLWNRRASLFIPKLKIDKFVKGAKAFYHTHPSKDEPSLTSADDYQWYVDCAFAYGIKDYYTVMDERMDFFRVTVNEENREDYLKLDEDKFSKDIDSVIDKNEKAVDKRHKDDDSMPDHVFYAEITRKTVQDLNNRFKRYFTITYTPYKKPIVRDNPGSDADPLPNRPTRIEDKYVAAALDELKGLDYSFVHYGGDEYAHTVYVYWWLRHHLVPTADYPKGRAFKWADYGMDSPHRAKLRDYLDEEVQPGWTNLDMLLLLGVYHDVGKLREKESGIHHSVESASMWRDEIAPELGISGPLAENIEFMLQSDVGRRDVDIDVFRRMVGDYYGVALLLQMVDMNVHHPLIFTGAAGVAKGEGHISRSSPEEYLHFKNTAFMTTLNTFLDDRPMSNPPPKVKSLNYVGSYETPIDGYLARESLAEWDATKVLKIDGKSGTPKYGNSFLSTNGAMLHLRWPVSDEDAISLRINLGKGTITMMFKEEQFGDDFGKSLADEIFYAIGEKLNELGAVEPIELEKQPQPEPLVNPRRAKNVQVITVSGPSGSGKTTISRYIARSLDAHIAPSYTTRTKRPKEKPGDRKFITHKQFEKMIEDGEMVEWQKQKNGHYYGRTFADMGAAPTIVVDTTIGGAMRIKDAFPNTFSVFLKPDVDENTLAKRIYRRGGMGKGEAKGRAKAAMNMVEAVQHMPFDLVIESRTSYYDDVAKEILKQIPKPNYGRFRKKKKVGPPNPFPDPDPEKRAAADKAAKEASWIARAPKSPNITKPYFEWVDARVVNTKTYATHAITEFILRDKNGTTFAEDTKDWPHKDDRELTHEYINNLERRDEMNELINKALNILRYSGPRDFLHIKSGAKSAIEAFHESPDYNRLYITYYNPPELSTTIGSHETTTLQYRKQRIEIDTLLAPLITHLWDSGVQTVFSCQGETFDDPIGDETKMRGPQWTNGYILMVAGEDYVAYRTRHLLWEEGGMGGPSSWDSESAYDSGAPVWIRSNYHRYGGMPYPDHTLALYWRGAPDHENLRHIYDAFGVEFPEDVMKNPQKTLDDEVMPEDEIDRKLRIHNLIKKGYIPWDIPEWLNRGILPADAPLGRNDDEVMLTNEQMLAIEDSEVYKDAYEAHKKEKADAAKAYRDEWNIKKLGDFNNPPYIPFCQECKDWYERNAEKLPRELPLLVRYVDVHRNQVSTSGYLRGLVRFYSTISKGGRMRVIYEKPGMGVFGKGWEYITQAHNLTYPYIHLTINSNSFTEKGQKAWAYSTKHTNGMLEGKKMAQQITFRINSEVLKSLDEGRGAVDDVEHMFFCLCHELSAHAIPANLPHYTTRDHCPDERCINGWVSHPTYPPSSLIKNRLYREYVREPPRQLGRTNAPNTPPPMGEAQGEQAAKKLIDNSTALTRLKKMVREGRTSSEDAIDFFNRLKPGMKKKYGVDMELITFEQSKSIPYLDFGRKFGWTTDNPGTFDDEKDILYFNSDVVLKDGRVFMLELIHEVGAIIIIKNMGISKASIPKVLPGYYLTHEVDSQVREGRFNPRRIPKPMKKGVTIYGKEWCPACKKAKAHMKKNKVKHRYYDIDQYRYYDEVIGPLTEDYEYIPAIFVDGEFIGGYSDYIEGDY